MGIHYRIIKLMELTDKKRYCPQVRTVLPLGNSAESSLDVAGLNYSCMDYQCCEGVFFVCMFFFFS